MAEIPILSNVTTFQNDTTAVNTFNNNMAAISSAFGDVLSLKGVSPNQMKSTLDMNSNQIINLAPPATTNSPARLIDVVSNPTLVVPPTGTSGHTVPFLDGTNTWSGFNTFTASTPPSLAVSVALSGTIPASSFGYTPTGAYVRSSSDNAAESGFTAGQNLPSLFYVENNFGGSSINNGRNAISVLLNQAAATSVSNAYKFFVGVASQAQCQFNENGTLGSELGVNTAVTGVGILITGATHFLANIGAEFSVANQTGSSSKIKAILGLTQWPSDAVAGSSVDSFIWAATDTGGPGLTTFLNISNLGGATPLTTSGSIIVTDTMTITNGFNFNNMTFTGNVMSWSGGTYSLTGAGVGNLKSAALINATSSSGTGVLTASTTQTSVNTSDTSDTAVAVNYTLSASSASNELVCRALAMTFTNNLSGGGAVSNARIFQLTTNTNTGTTTGEADCIFLGTGTTSGTVTTGYGLHISALQGTTKWGIGDDSGSNWYNLSGGLALGSNTSAGSGTLLLTGTGGTVSIKGPPTTAGQLQFASAGSFTANGTVATTMTSLGPTGASTTIVKWLTITDNTGATHYIPCY